MMMMMMIDARSPMSMIFTGRIIYWIRVLEGRALPCPHTWGTSGSPGSKFYHWAESAMTNQAICQSSVYHISKDYSEALNEN
jgi:hypothetical protein